MKLLQRFLNSVENWLTEVRTSTLSFRFFRIGTYSVLLLKMLFIWPELSTFYKHILSRGPTSEFKVAEFIFLPALYNYPHYVWAVACALVIFAILYKSNRWLSAMVFIVSLNYMSLMSLTTNTGDVLLNFFAFSLIFIQERPKPSTYVKLINIATLLILKINICLMYFVNGYGKIVQQTWRDGTFMQSVWQLNYYANPNLIPTWFTNSTACLVIGWSVMIFEICFPLLIWVAPIRKWLLPTGLLFHTCIGLFLSIPDFALTVMVAYVLFVDMDERVKFFRK